MNTWQILCGVALAILRTLPEASVQCCVTSPPYWGLRDYGTALWEGGDRACAHSAPDDAGVPMPIPSVRRWGA
jgi:site-specific DNA-methyltransferase (cytosine-N4-specific)